MKNILQGIILHHTAFMVLVSANEIIGEGFEDTNLTETIQERRLDEIKKLENKDRS